MNVITQRLTHSPLLHPFSASEHTLPPPLCGTVQFCCSECEGNHEVGVTELADGCSPGCLKSVCSCRAAFKAITELDFICLLSPNTGVLGAALLLVCSSEDSAVHRCEVCCVFVQNQR